jgi:hypothetical protein
MVEVSKPVGTTMGKGQTMDRNVLRIFVGALAVALVVLGYTAFQQQKQLDELVVKIEGGTASVTKQ